MGCQPGRHFNSQVCWQRSGNQGKGLQIKFRIDFTTHQMHVHGLMVFFTKLQTIFVAKPMVGCHGELYRNIFYTALNTCLRRS